MRLRRTMWTLEERLVSEMISPPSALTPRWASSSEVRLQQQVGWKTKPNPLFQCMIAIHSYKYLPNQRPAPKQPTHVSSTPRSRPDLTSWSSQAQLVANPHDCHTFYHCDELTPQKQSCGDLMFNNIRMVSSLKSTIIIYWIFSNSSSTSSSSSSSSQSFSDVWLAAVSDADPTWVPRPWELQIPTWTAILGLAQVSSWW